MTILSTNKVKNDELSISQCKKYVYGRKLFVRKSAPEKWKNAKANAKMREKLEKENPSICNHSSKKDNTRMFILFF